MVAYLLTGVIVGIFIGLLLAPVLHSWVQWRYARELDARYRAAAHERRRGSELPS